MPEGTDDLEHLKRGEGWATGVYGMPWDDQEHADGGDGAQGGVVESVAEFVLAEHHGGVDEGKENVKEKEVVEAVVEDAADVPTNVVQEEEREIAPIVTKDVKVDETERVTPDPYADVTFDDILATPFPVPIHHIMDAPPPPTPPVPALDDIIFKGVATIDTDHPDSNVVPADEVIFDAEREFVVDDVFAGLPSKPVVRASSVKMAEMYQMLEETFPVTDPPPVVEEVEKIDKGGDLVDVSEDVPVAEEIVLKEIVVVKPPVEEEVKVVPRSGGEEKVDGRVTPEVAGVAQVCDFGLLIPDGSAFAKFILETANSPTDSPPRTRLYSQIPNSPH